jgi:uncharacterized membrane protein
MHAFYLFSVWLHILAAIVWIGGMAFLILVLVPAIRQPQYRGVFASLIHWTGLRFRLVGWVCMGLLLLTGTFNLAYRGFGWTDLWSGKLWQGSFGTILGAKLLLVAVILVASTVHDFSIGPRATSELQQAPASTEAVRLRRQATWLGRLNMLLALVVVALGVMLVRGWP